MWEEGFFSLEEGEVMRKKEFSWGFFLGGAGSSRKIVFIFYFLFSRRG